MRATARALLQTGGTVAAGTGHHVGKSYAAAGLILWATTCFPDGMTVITTSATHRQVEEMWQKVHEQYNSAPVDLGGHLTHTRYKHADKCYAIGFSTDQPTRMQGYQSTARFSAPSTGFRPAPTTPR
jgi:hypothetical protein